jgi:hypothetical protein
MGDYLSQAPALCSAARPGTACFGAALNTHLHLHVCITDGVFSALGGGVRFHDARIECVFHAIVNSKSTGW